MISSFYITKPICQYRISRSEVDLIHKIRDEQKQDDCQLPIYTRIITLDNSSGLHSLSYI